MGYVIVSQIILVNLLITMMGHTFSVIQATERMSPVPPPLNLPQTSYAFVMTNIVSVLCPQYTPVEKDRNDGYDLSKAKKAKQKVAQKLLLKLKRSQDDEAQNS